MDGDGADCDEGCEMALLETSDKEVSQTTSNGEQVQHVKGQYGGRRNKEQVRQLQFIVNNFPQMRCKNYCEPHKSWLGHKKKTLFSQNEHVCTCLMPKSLHTDSARRNTVKSWSVAKNMEHLLSFGDVEIPGVYYDIYIDLPRGYRKYIRLDDKGRDPSASLWQLLTQYWELQFPNQVISVTGGDIDEMKSSKSLHMNFVTGIMKTAVKTKAWIFTEGLNHGTSREIGRIFQEELAKSEFSEDEDHSSIPLVGFAPWSAVADRQKLEGNHLSSAATYYPYGVPTEDALEPYHVVYVLADDGSSGPPSHEPFIREKMESYISKKLLKYPGASGKGLKIPVVILVVGGDKFTLQKVKEVTCKENKHPCPVVVVNGSGRIATLLAKIHQEMERGFPSKKGSSHSRSGQESLFEGCTQSHSNVYNTLSKEEQKCLKTIMMEGRHLIEVFGEAENDTKDLDKAVLLGTFRGISEISTQIAMTMAMDRYDIASEEIFVERRKAELQWEVIQDALLQALKTYKTDFIKLLIEKDVDGRLEYREFLTTRRLHILHEENMKSTNDMSTVLRSLAKRDPYGNPVAKGEELLPQIGRIINRLLGNRYRLLYQEGVYRTANEASPIATEEEASWHLFLWAILGNQVDIADLFLEEIDSSKIGAAMLAYVLLKRLAVAAKRQHEVELEKELEKNSEYYQDLALNVLESLYKEDQMTAYRSLVSDLRYWGKGVTPLTIANDGQAMKFMGRSCCQTFLHRVWLQCMDLGTASWKLFPIFAFMPLNIPFIVFNKGNLAFGTERAKESFVDRPDPCFKEEEAPEGDFTHDSQKGESEEKDETSDKETVETLEAKEQSNTTVVCAPKDDTAVSEEENTFPLSWAWFCVKNYYTAPVNKFLFYMMSYIVFLGLFTHFLLVDLKPVHQLKDVTLTEWLVMIWVSSITLIELSQLVTMDCTGPLHGLSWKQVRSHWHSTWHWYERVNFVSGIYRLELWLSGPWNAIDLFMLSWYYLTVAVRFTIPEVDFEVVRIMFSISLIIFYFRVLRLGYVMRQLGPRIITIKAMTKDLVQFMVIIAVFVISFGVAYQAILNPNAPLSWHTVVDIIWRPYWQMFGDLMLDVDDDDNDSEMVVQMGREARKRNCTSSRSLAKANPETMVYCSNWVVLLLLAVYMLITNILLLNLLIAIFSHSFEKIESHSRTIWRYHMYDLVQEYYEMVWLPPPLSALCSVFNICLWLISPLRMCCYKKAKQRHLNRLKSRSQSEKAPNNADELNVSQDQLVWQNTEKDERMEMEAKAATREDFFSFFYLNKDDTSVFRQSYWVRDERWEDKAYRRYNRARHAQRKKNV